MNDKESIVNKIKALLNTTIENGATPYEAEQALSLANKLMVKYYIEDSDLLEPKEFIYEEVNNPRFRVDFHPVGNALAYLFSAKSILKCQRNKPLFIIFFGSKPDVQCCTYFYHYLSTCLFRDTQDFRHKIRDWTYQGLEPIRVFQQSWIDEMVHKINLMKVDQKNQYYKATGNALAIYNKEQLIEEAANQEFNLSEFKGPERHDFINEQAKHAGIQAAREVDLNPGLGGAQKCLTSH